MWSLPSATLRCDELNEGATTLSSWAVSLWLDSRIASSVMTSTGTDVSSWVRGVRDPTTTMTSLRRGSRVICTSRLSGALPWATTTVRCTSACPTACTRSAWLPGGSASE